VQQDASLLTSAWKKTRRQIKNTLSSCAVVSCRCDLILLYSVVLYLVRAAHTYDFRFVINWTPNTWQAVESDRDVSDKSHMFSPQGWHAGNGLYKRVQGQSCSRQSTVLNNTLPRQWMLKERQSFQLVSVSTLPLK
jgi:hypothetical protein